MEVPAQRESMHQPVVNIVGELVALGPHRRDLLLTYQRWINDFGALRTLGAIPPAPTTLEREEKWYDAQPANEVRFTVYEATTWLPVGTTALHAIDYRNRVGTFGIFIGDADARGKGYGTEATHLTLDFAFVALGLHNVCSPSPSSTSPASAPTSGRGSSSLAAATPAGGLMAGSGTMSPWSAWRTASSAPSWPRSSPQTRNDRECRGAGMRDSSAVNEGDAALALRMTMSRDSRQEPVSARNRRWWITSSRVSNPARRPLSNTGSCGS
jgi:hypothetical protein